MPHSQQRHAYKNNTHKIRRNLKTKCNKKKKEKKQRSVFGMYTEVDVTQRIFEEQYYTNCVSWKETAHIA